MAFCGNCGGELPLGTKFCPRCGTKVQMDIPPLEEPVRQRNTGAGAGTGSYSRQATGTGYVTGGGSSSAGGSASGGYSGYGGSPYDRGTSSSPVTPGSARTSAGASASYGTGTSYGGASSGPADKAALMAEGEAKFGMKWFKFMIYFGLFAAVLVCISNLGSLMNSYGSDADRQRLYQMFPGLQTADMILIGGSVLAAVLILITRFKLAGFKSGSIGWFIVGYGVNLASVLVHTVLVQNEFSKAGLTGADVQEVLSQAYINIGFSLVMIIINVIYLNKRKELFRN